MPKPEFKPGDRVRFKPDEAGKAGLTAADPSGEFTLETVESGIARSHGLKFHGRTPKPTSQGWAVALERVEHVLDTEIGEQDAFTK